MKRILALLLVLMMCLPVVVACKKDEAPEETGTDAPRPLAIIADGASEYVIVYTAGEGDMKNVSFNVGKLIQKTVRTVTGVELELVSDTKEAQAKEILIGATSRADSYTSPVAAETYLNGYSLFVDGERIILEAGSKTGMYFGAYALLKDLLGVDLGNGEEAVRDESKTDCSVMSDYALTEALASAQVPYMDIPLEQFAVCYDSANYIQMRAAITLQQEVKDSDAVVMERIYHSWAKDDGAYFYFRQDDAAKDGEFKIRTEGKRVILSAKDYYGYVSAVRAVMKLREDFGFYPFRGEDARSGNYLDYLKSYEGTSRYAFDNASEYRVMFYNVLWDNTAVVERAKLQGAMIEVYRPDVVGFQEFKEVRRGSLVPLLQKLGYAESMNYTDGNMVSASYGTGTDPELYNYVPIFYNSATTKCIESGFHRYTAQVSEWESASKSLSWGIYESKSTGERYMVVNTHMCTQDDTTRGKQAKEVVELVNEVLTRYDVPVFLGGDYNGKYGAANFKYFASTGGFTDVEKNNLATVYTSKLKSYHRPYPEYNLSIGLMWPAAGDDTGNNPEESVDHIMIKNASAVKISVYGVIADDCTISGGDHFPIFFDFSINES